MKTTNSKDFVTTISQKETAFILFHNNEDSLAKLKKALNGFEDKVIEFVNVDEQDDMLLESLNIPDTPCIMAFKEGKFSGYKNKEFTPTKVKKFLG